MTRPRAEYAGPVCPRGGELRITMAPVPKGPTANYNPSRSNRQQRIWCTCMAEMDGSVSPSQWDFDWLMDIDVDESHVPIWKAHCANVAEGGNGHVELEFRY